MQDSFLMLHRRVERRVRGVLDSAPDAMVIVDSSGRILAANTQVKILFGYNDKELIGVTIETLMPERFRAKHRAHRSHFLLDPRTRPMGVGLELYGQNKSGAEIPIEISLSPLKMARQMTVAAAIRDTSDRKEKEALSKARLNELQTLQEIGQNVLNSLNLNAIAQGTLDRILTLGTFDIGAIRFHESPESGVKLLATRGYRNPENIRATPRDPKNASAWREWRERVASEGAYVVEDLSAVPRFRHFREERVRSAVVVPVRVESSVVGTITLGSREPRKFSASEIRLLEAIASQMGIALQKAQLYEEKERLYKEAVESKKEVESALKVKNEFLSVMSHELKTPLNVILGYTTMMMEGMLGEVSPKQAAVLKKLVDQSYAQLDMIDNVFKAMALESAKTGVETRESNPVEFLDQLRSEYDAGLLRDGLALQWNYPHDLLTLRIDPGKLRVILRNLIGNAIKFTSKGTVTVSAETSGDNRTGGWVEFKVADTGLGIAEEQLPLIFEKFHQVDSSQTRAFGGVGMGLHIVKKFTELMGGTVDVESELGKGSVFTVKFEIAGATE